MQNKSKLLTNWGNYPVNDCMEFIPQNLKEINTLVEENKNIIARGLGRCYGDSSLAPQVIDTKNLNKFLDFDKETGMLECESGVSLEDIQDTFVPKGWMLYVTPGTKYVTVGGAVASDVHGKNHHQEGTFCEYVKEISLITDIGPVTCSEGRNQELFKATCGGQGLTGIIVAVKVQLKKVETAYINQKLIKTKNLADTFDIFESNKDSTYSAAWIDCMVTDDKLGRSVVFLGMHSKIVDLKHKKYGNGLQRKTKPKLTVPIYFPEFVLNKLTISLFNNLYYHKQIKREKIGIADYDSFFYPLDSILKWNKIYGKRGFLQYQLVIPLRTSREGIQEIIEKVQELELYAFFSVLKLFGKANSNYLSFPMEGLTLAMDFAYEDGIESKLAQLDEIVLKYGGKVYLTKDSRIDAVTISKMYPNLNKFKKIKNKFSKKFNSYQSLRLKIS